MRIQFQNLKPLLAEVTHGSASKRQMTELVQLSRAIIHSYLTHYRHSVTRLCLEQGLTVTEVAYDCIGEAFARNGTGCFTQLDNFVSSLRDRLDFLPDHEVFLAFKAFIIRIAEAQLARLYAQADPGGAKIYRNIRESVNAGDCFVLIKDFRGQVLQIKRSDARNELLPFPQDELERRFLDCASLRHPIPELLNIIATILAEQSSYRKSVTLFHVVALVKMVYKQEEAAEQPLRFDGLSEEEIEQIRTEVERAVNEKILVTYYVKGKVNRVEAEAMAAALREMTSDWCRYDGDSPSLYQYLGRHIDLDEEKYNDAFRTKMEYLMKIARDEFAARLTREL